MVMLFGILDWLVGAESFGALLALRLAISSTLLLAMWASYRSWFDAYYLPIMCAIYIATSLGILSMPLISAGNRIVQEHYYVGALLCLSAMMTLTLFSAGVVLALTALIAVAHLSSAAIVLEFPRNSGVLASQLFFLWSSACIGFIGIWFRNRMLIEKLDLTQKLAEQAAISERVSLEKSRFMAAASHDLRQPLQAIALFGAILEKDLKGAESYLGVQRLMQAVTGLQSSLEAMLDISKLDAGVVRASLRPVNLNAIFLGLNDVFFAQAEAKGLQLRLRSTPLWCYSDSILLSRLLANLVDNAIKYTHAGGVMVGCRTRADYISIEVRDSGIGIAEDQTELIFDEFYQIDNPARDRSKGLGLGLSIVKRLSRVLGHQLRIRSAPGCGTTFSIRLKAAPSQQDESWERTIGLPGAELPVLSSRILLVDDEVEIRLALTSLLQSFQVDVVAVGNIAAAEQELQKAATVRNAFDVCICDFRLANGEDGLEFALSVAKRPEFCMGVMLLTGETAPDRLHRAADSGIRILFKPVNSQELLSALADLNLVAK